MKTSIYYFTGTGNSLKIAKDLKQALPGTRLIQICKQNMKIQSDITSDKIGFVFPVYYRGLPHMVRDFIKNLKINPQTYFFAIANYGGYSAISFLQINELLKEKSTYLAANFGIPMPGNMWFMYYPHPKKDFTDRTDLQIEKTRDIAQQIKAKAEIKLVPFPTYKKERAIYDAFDPAQMDADFWLQDNCTGCGICAKICPAENIKMENNKPVWQHQCQYCLACIHWCPKEAIEFKEDSLAKERYHNPAVQCFEVMPSNNII